MPSRNISIPETDTGSTLQQWRILAGYKTQTAFAKEIGVDQGQISRWESGKQAPKFHFVKKIVAVVRARGVQVTAQDLPSPKRRPKQSGSTIAEPVPDQTNQTRARGDHEGEQGASLEDDIKSEHGGYNRHIAEFRQEISDRLPVPATLVHQVCNAAQIALDGAPSTIRYQLPYQGRLLLSEAVISIEPGGRIIRAEGTRLKQR